MRNSCPYKLSLYEVDPFRLDLTAGSWSAGYSELSRLKNFLSEKGINPGIIANKRIGSDHSIIRINMTDFKILFERDYIGPCSFDLVPIGKASPNGGNLEERLRTQGKHVPGDSGAAITTRQPTPYVSTLDVLRKHRLTPVPATVVVTNPLFRAAQSPPSATVLLSSPSKFNPPKNLTASPMRTSSESPQKPLSAPFVSTGDSPVKARTRPTPSAFPLNASVEFQHDNPLFDSLPITAAAPTTPPASLSRAVNKFKDTVSQLFRKPSKTPASPSTPIRSALGTLSFNTIERQPPRRLPPPRPNPIAATPPAPPTSSMQTLWQKSLSNRTSTPTVTEATSLTI